MKKYFCGFLRRRTPWLTPHSLPHAHTQKEIDLVKINLSKVSIKNSSEN
ncbi:MAG: hypothetical protein AAFR12_20220 [Cyanobacteria bacterium J06626_6]